MRRRNALWLLTLLLVMTGAAPAQAAPPWQSLFGFRKIEADPSKPYHLEEKHGPWLVLCASFAGEKAQQEAHTLVLELRSKFRLTAYLHKREYDYTQTVPGLGVNRYGEPKKMRYRNAARFDEYAVLVGDFESIEDPSLQKTLERIKHLHPACLDLSDGQNTTQRYAGLREFRRRLSANPETRAKGPMGSSFATRNPLIAEEFFAPKGLDPLVLKMNDGVKHSLLNCPGKISVRVATFRGRVVIDQKEIEALENGDRTITSRLADAAEKAHRLTEMLRSQNIEAYEFHDRNESMVTVGSFDAVGTPRPDGKTEINPAVHHIMKTYGAQRVETGTALSGLKPRSIGGILLDVQPLPVQVPRKSIGADYARGNY